MNSSVFSINLSTSLASGLFVALLSWHVTRSARAALHLLPTHPDRPPPSLIARPPTYAITCTWVPLPLLRCQISLATLKRLEGRKRLGLEAYDPVVGKEKGTSDVKAGK